MAKTHENEDDERWLAIIAGTASSADQLSDPLAQEVRRQLLVRSKRIDAHVPDPDDMLLQQIQFRVRREEATSSRWLRPKVWGMAASVMLGVALVYQLGIGPFDADEQILLRSDDAQALIRTSDPRKRAEQLASKLRERGVQVELDKSDPTRVKLKAPNQPVAVSLLQKEGIQILTNGDSVLVILVPKRR
ncbi:MAG TPA: hypothetical protein DCF63_10250 [Planctomycetaceae bacterium]|nr:hypothetical protein [Planctomycetaceae bacterium]